MSRLKRPNMCGGDSFPRVSGDEPGTTLLQRTADLFSPRERG